MVSASTRHFHKHYKEKCDFERTVNSAVHTIVTITELTWRIDGKLQCLSCQKVQIWRRSAVSVHVWRFSSI